MEIFVVAHLQISAATFVLFLFTIFGVSNSYEISSLTSQNRLPLVGHPPASPLLNILCQDTAEKNNARSQASRRWMNSATTYCDRAWDCRLVRRDPSMWREGGRLGAAISELTTNMLWADRDRDRTRATFFNPTSRSSRPRGLV